MNGDGKSETRTGRNPHRAVATGSKARHLPNVPADNKIVSDNEGTLAFDAAPKKLAVIGASVIGLERVSVWRRLGSKGTILEALPDFLGTTDSSLQKEAAKLFKKQGLTIHLGVKIDNVKATDKSVSISYKDRDGNAQTLDADRLIVSIGRVPNTDNLGLDSIGLATDERGFIPVDGHCATNVPNVYAIGNVVRGPMLPHKAEDEGVLVAEIIDGQKPHIDYNCIPWVIYTHPEIAWIGQTEQALKAEGRAIGIGETDGFIKVIVDAQTDEILGVHIISANASDLIAEAVVAMEFKAASEDIGRRSLAAIRRRHYVHRNMPRLRMRLQFLQHGETRAVRQADIEQNGARRAFLRHAPRICGRAADDAAILQFVREIEQHLREVRLVLDHQARDGARARLPRGRRRSRGSLR